MLAILIGLCLVGQGSADLRLASQPRYAYKIINEAGAIPFVVNHIHMKYMIPNTFGYQGLGPATPAESANPTYAPGRVPPALLASQKTGAPGGQKYNNYDNFLRSNIDNEQDNRNFDTEPGEDHLPFRTFATAMNRYHSSDIYDAEYNARRGIANVGPIDLAVTAHPGKSMIVPMRWNNPHAAEKEVNIWIFPRDSQPVVIPIKKPTCSGEGHQDNVFKFIVPEDFVKLGDKIPGFEGCNADTRPMCALQLYSHSVESRQYALAFPIIVPGHQASSSGTRRRTGTGTGSVPDEIEPMRTDPGIDISDLRDLCLSSSDPSAIIPNAIPRWARLVSDVYTHSYMNSDYSPYSGQQFESISKNLQASCVNKMVVGNRGELGASILPRKTKIRIHQLYTLEDQIYKRYESLANRLINEIEKKDEYKDQTQNTGSVIAGDADQTVQKLETCFRCAEVGSTVATRLQTNTYIPSFQLPEDLQGWARHFLTWNLVGSSRRRDGWHSTRRRDDFGPGAKYAGLISDKGQVQIYVAALTDLMPFFHASQAMGVLHQPAMLKTTLATYEHPYKHMKINMQGVNDKGYESSLLAKSDWGARINCPFECINTTITSKCHFILQGARPLLPTAGGTCITGKCAGCTALFSDGLGKNPPMTVMATAIASNGVVPDIGGVPISQYPDTIVRNPSNPSPWNLKAEAPAGKPTSPPWNKPGPAPAGPSPVKDTRRRSPKRRRRGGKTSRRRSARRRRRRSASLLEKETVQAVRPADIRRAFASLLED